MTLKLKLTKAEYEKISDAVVKTLYVEKDGDYVLDAEKEDVSGLMSALEKERSAAKAAKELAGIAKSYQDLGKSPEEIKELLEKLHTAETDELAKKGEWDKLKQQLNDAHKTELEKKDTEIAKMRTTLENKLIDAAAIEVISSLKGVPQLLLPHIKAATKVVEDNGKFDVRVIGEDGAPRVNNKGEFLTIKDLVEDMKKSEIFGRAFEGTNASGGGSNPSPGKNPAGQPYVISRVDASDPRKYRAAKETAEKAGQELQIAPE